LKTEVSPLILSAQFKRINEPGIDSFVDVSNTLIKESTTELLLESIGGGSEHRGFSIKIE
jgi:hypothetical protein